MRSSLARRCVAVAWLALATLAACSGETYQASKRRGACYTHTSVVEEYLQRIADLASKAAIAAAPFPRPPFDPQACLHGGSVELGIYSFGRCDSARADAYTDVIANNVQTAVNAAGLLAPEERAQIALRIKLTREGAATIAVHDAPSAEAGEQVAAIARKLSPFEAPADSIRESVTDQSLFLWVTLPGATRAPVRIHD